MKLFTMGPDEARAYVERVNRYTQRVRRVGWTGNFVIVSVGVVVAAVVDFAPMVPMMLWAGIPASLVTFHALVARWPRLVGRCDGRRVGLRVMCLIVAAAAATWVSLAVGAASGALVGITVWLSELLLAREIAARTSVRSAGPIPPQTVSPEAP